MSNSAPEKIFVHVKANKELGTTWHGKKITNNDIEYIRTDTFIEKARKWFEQESEYFEFDGIRRYAKDDFEDFRNYMKNE